MATQYLNALANYNTIKILFYKPFLLVNFYIQQL